MNRMWVYDFEVFKDDWMVVFEDFRSDERVEFVNDVDGLRNFYNESDLYIGFNNKRYDDYIFKTILLGENPKIVNDIIIVENNLPKLFQLYDMFKFKLLSYDISQDALRGSLKEFEGYMGLDIEESSVDFTIDRKLTDEEIEETLKYCRHDVSSTKKLAIERVDGMQVKFSLVKEYKLTAEDLKKSNAQLTAKILNARKRDFKDEFTPYEPPKELILDKNKDLLDFYKNINYSNKDVRDIGGVEHTLRFGGLHGALPNFIYEGELWLLDVGSYYPSMMIEFDFLSRTVKGKYRKLFKEIYDNRMELKRKGVKGKSALYKLVLNTVYGAMKDQYNALYDPKNANNICITGQLLLIDLIEKLEGYCQLVQSNTDGILIIPHNKEKIMEVVNEWENRTRMNMEVDKFKAVYQKDVNNYIMVTENDEIKAIGSMTRQAELNDYDDLRKTNAILDDAVVEYFVNKKSPEEVINQCEDLSRFQIITKTGRTFDKTVWYKDDEEIKVNKVNRVYATIDKSCGRIYKVKGQSSYHKLPVTPPHCELANNDNFNINKLDRDWYIEQAHDRIKQYKGET